MISSFPNSYLCLETEILAHIVSYLSLSEIRMLAFVRGQASAYYDSTIVMKDHEIIYLGSEIAQEVKSPAAKFENLSSNPRTLLVEEKNYVL